MAIEIQRNLNVVSILSKWYQGKVDIKAPNMTWSAHLKLVNEQKSEEEKIDTLFNTLEQFFAENNELFGKSDN